jgi:hypothetical protein
LCEVIRVRVRYDTPDEKGETRRERNPRFGVTSPEIIEPVGGEYLLDWYDELTSGTLRVSESNVNPISWREFQAWVDVTGKIVWPFEFEILREMDKAYCDEMGIEIAAYVARITDKES